MTTGTTTNGYRYNIDENKFRDFRFVRMISKYNKAAGGTGGEEAAMTLVIDMTEFIFGEDETDNIVDYVASQNNGIADVEEIMKMLEEVMNSLGEEVKN